MQSFKRTSNQHFPSAEVDETTQALQTIGMRIRKSINDGYMVPDSTTGHLPLMNNHGNNNSYMTSYEYDHLKNSNMNGSNDAFKTPNIQRVALPFHLQSSGPPALDYNGSTASSLADWDNDMNDSRRVQLHNFQTISQQQSFQSPTKRKRDEESDVQFVSKSNASSNSELPLNSFVNKYGPLSFDEEF